MGQTISGTLGDRKVPGQSGDPLTFATPAASIIARVVTIPAGTFTMGGGADDSQPLHAVELTAYLIGKYEITDVEYKAFIAWGDTLSLEKANYLKDDAAKETSGTKPVGSYAPNAFGLYDMNGNAWEWVADWYKFDYYRESPGTNPLGPPVGTVRIVRGGAWLDGDPALLDLSHRHEAPAGTYSYSIGFRIVVE